MMEGTALPHSEDLMLRSRRRRRLEAWPQAWGRPHGSRRHSASLRAFMPVFGGLWTRVNALKAPHHEVGATASDFPTVQSCSIGRRAFIMLVATAAIWPHAARAQQSERARRI